MIHCKYDELLAPKKLKDHPRNRNKHGSDQIERLAELYKFHGIRHPIIVSKLSGFIVAGHGRKLAAIRAGITEVPVVYQDFDTLEKEYAFIQADNAIALWADLDLEGISEDLKGMNVDVLSLGIKNFQTSDIDFINQGDESSEWAEDMPEFEEGEKAIKLIIQFKTEEDRENFAKSHKIEINRKMNNQWISIKE